jgi:hypothetical protein
LRLIERIRRNSPTKEESATWASVANSNKYTDVRRRRAVFQLFDRHVYQGMTLEKVAGLLEHPSWLKQKDVQKVEGTLRGYIGIHAVPDETIFRISVLESERAKPAIYVRVEDPLSGDPPTGDAFYDALQGENTETARLKVTAVVVSPTAKEDIACIKHRVERSPQSGSPRHWEFVFTNDSKGTYARQLDFFGIELAIMMPDNRLVYVSHLSDQKPNTRSVQLPTPNEKRYFLTERESDSRVADEELLSRAGIKAGNRLVLKMFPKQLVRQLTNLERSYRGADPWKIEKTRFGVRSRGHEFAFYVVTQTPLHKTTSDAGAHKSVLDQRERENGDKSNFPKNK